MIHKDSHILNRLGGCAICDDLQTGLEIERLRYEALDLRAKIQQMTTLFYQHREVLRIFMSEFDGDGDWKHVARLAQRALDCEVPK